MNFGEINELSPIEEDNIFPRMYNLNVFSSNIYINYFFIINVIREIKKFQKPEKLRSIRMNDLEYILAW